MSLWLRALGAVVMMVGLGGATVAGWHLTRDTAFAEAAAAYARHPEHPLFQADYYVAAARHYGLAALVVIGLFAGFVASSVLLGLSEVLRRMPRR